MKILDRYILVTFIKNYLISLVVLIGLYIVLDLVFNFDELVEVKAQGGGASFIAVLRVVFDYYFYQSFLIFSQLSGVIAVVATAFTLVRMSRFNELTAMLAAGVPLLRVASPILISCVVLNIILLPLDQELVIPAMIPKLTRSHDQIGQQTARAYRIEAMQDNNRGILFVAKYIAATSETPAHGFEFDLIERDENFNPVAHLTASRADWDASKQSWQLTNGKRHAGIQPGARRTKDAEVTEYQSSVTPDEISLFKNAEYVELLSTPRINELLQRPLIYRATNLLRVKHSRVTRWLMDIVGVLLCIGVILTREPKNLKVEGIKLLVVIGISMGSVFLCHQLADFPPAGQRWIDLWPALMAWTPVLAFAPLAIVLLDRMHQKKS